MTDASLPFVTSATVGTDLEWTGGAVALLARQTSAPLPNDPSVPSEDPSEPRAD